MLRDNRYSDMKCVIHFGNNRREIMREFQEKRARLAMRYIQTLDIALLRNMDLRFYAEPEEKAA